MINIVIKSPGNNPYSGKIEKPVNIDKPLYYGELQTPVYSNLDIKGGEWTDGKGKKQSYNDILFDTVLFVVDQTKNIVKTNVAGSNGSVKEYISDGDYLINIQGIITGKNNSRPDADIWNLKRVLDAPVTLQVNSKYLNSLGIYSIVVEHYNFPQLMGQYSQQPFSIDCLSDIPVILQINN